MNQLKEMLEAYRNGERGLPTYAELAELAFPAEPLFIRGSEYNYSQSLDSWSVKQIKGAVS